MMTVLLSATPSGILKTSELKPGMKGYGLTVFAGTKPVKFDVEVISVMPKAMLSQDLILVRCKHPVLKHAGVIAGMSGSPIYINGKFAGGLGYGYGFSKDPIAMLTPAEDIVKTIKRPLRGVNPWGMKKSQSVASYFGKTRAASAAMFAARIKTGSIVPLQMALSVSGMTPGVFAALFPTFAKLGPVMPAGTVANAVVKDYEPGGAVGIWLVRGDINLQAIGTVTHIIGKRIAVFSHPFLTMGETLLPAGHAFIHTVIARQSSSMKLGALLKPSGALIKDEQATVVIDKSMNPGAIPMTVEVASKGEKFKYNFEIAQNRFLTPNYINGIVRIALARSQQNLTDLTYTINYEFKMKGLKSITFTDYFSSSRGLSLGYAFWGGLANAYALRGEIAMNLLMNNPWKRMAVESVKVKAMVVTGLNSYRIKSVKTSAPLVRVGKAFRVDVTLKPEVGEEIQKSFSVTLPDSFRGNRIWIQVTGGREMSIDEANPENIDQLVNYISKSLDSHNLVLTIKTPSPAIGIDGKMVRHVPLSVLDTLVRTSDSEKPPVMQTQMSKTLRIPEIVMGRTIIETTVKQSENEAR